MDKNNKHNDKLVSWKTNKQTQKLIVYTEQLFKLSRIIIIT